MTTTLLSLPIDALLEVFKLISSYDLLSLNLTCRTLHSICSNDSPWRVVVPPLPLDIPSGHDLGSLCGSQLRKLHLKAIHLDETLWSHHPEIQPNPSKVVKMSRPGLISQVKFLSADWLVTVSSRASEVIGVVFGLWRFGISEGNQEPSWTCVCSIDTTLRYCSSIAASWCKSGEEALVTTYASTQSGGGLQIYTLSKTPSINSSESERWRAQLQIVVEDITGSGIRRGITSSTQIVQHMVGIAATKKQDGGDPTQIWVYFVNSVTKRSFCTRVYGFEGFSTFPVLHISRDLRYFVLIVGNYGIEHADPSQLIQVYALPPEILSTVLDEDATNQAGDDMAPTVISSSQPFSSALKTQYQTSSAPPMANPSLLPGDTHLDASDVLHIFQPCIEGQGAYVARFSIEVDDHNHGSQIKLIYGSFIATNLVCRSEWSALSRHEGSGPRGFFHAGERLSNGDVMEELFRYRLPIENDPSGSAGGRSALVSKMQILNTDNIWGNLPLAFAYDDASGRICQSTWGHVDEGLVYGLTIVDMV